MGSWCDVFYLKYVLNIRKVLLKKTLLIIAIILFSFMGIKIVTLLQHKAQVEHSLATIPKFSFQTIEGIPFTKAELPENVSIVFVYFHTECDYCLYEAKDIAAHKDQFKGTIFLFVSTESVENITNFAKEQGLEGYDTILFLQDRSHIFAKTFDAPSIPYILIYGKDKELLARHRGQLKAEKIISVLHKQR